MSTETDVVLPIVHLNGTSKDRLMANLNNVWDALDKVFHAMREASPNGRDYYPDPGRMDLAVAQHRRRMQMITDLQQELTEEIEGIDAQ